MPTHNQVFPLHFDSFIINILPPAPTAFSMAVRDVTDSLENNSLNEVEWKNPLSTTCIQPYVLLIRSHILLDARGRYGRLTLSAPRMTFHVP